jgi:hypothetical protein
MRKQRIGYRDDHVEIGRIRAGPKRSRDIDQPNVGAVGQLGGDHPGVGNQIAQRLVHRSVCPGEGPNQIKVENEPPQGCISRRIRSLDIADLDFGSRIVR